LINQYIFKLHLPYTIIDSGFWYQATFPQLPSGRVKYAMIDENTEIFGDGNVEDSIIDLADLARYTIRIIADDRTINKKVFCYGQTATQNEIIRIMEKVSGEKVQLAKVNFQSSERTRKKLTTCYSVG
jgi:nucleoside-diphosphate-sugar epimerase